jgi:hypothetical protein
MKKLITLFTFLMLSLTTVIFSGCEGDEEEENGTFSLQIELYHDGVPMTAWNEIIAVDGVNEFRIEFFRYYLSNLKLIQGNSEIFLTDVVLANAAVENGMTFNFQVKEGNYDAFKTGIGLDAVLNAKDPVAFPNEHPLSAFQSMYWSWGSKYRFIRIDGRANELGSVFSTDDILVAYHPGADEFYRERLFEKSFQITGGNTTVLKLRLDVAKFFDGPGGVIDIPAEPQTHTEPSDYEIAEKITDNFAAAFELL